MSCRSESRGPRLTKLFGRRKDTIPEDRAVSPEQYAPNRRMRSGSRPPPDSAYSSANEDFKAEHDVNNTSNDDYGWGAPQHSTSRSVSDSRSRSTTRDFKGRGSKRHAQHSPDDDDVDEDIDVDEQIEYDSDTGEWVKTVTTTTTTKTTTTTTRTKRTGRGKSRPGQQRKKTSGKVNGNSTYEQPDVPSLPASSQSDAKRNTHNGTQTRTSFSPQPTSRSAYNQSKPLTPQNDQPSHGSLSRRPQSQAPNQSTSRSVAPSPSRPATNASSAPCNDWPEPEQQSNSNNAPQSSTRKLGVLPSPTNSPSGSTSSVYENARSSNTLNDQYQQQSNAGRSASRDPPNGKQAQGLNGANANSYGSSQGSSPGENTNNGRGNPQFTINGSSISSYGGQPLANNNNNNNSSSSSQRDSSATRQSDGGTQSDSSTDYSRADSGISVGEAAKSQQTSPNNGQQQQRGTSATRATSRDELQQQGKAKYQQGGNQGTGGSSWLNTHRNSGDSSSSSRPDSARKQPGAWAQPHSPPDPLYNPPENVPYFHSIGGVSSTSCTGPLSSQQDAAPGPSVQRREESVGRRWFG